VKSISEVKQTKDIACSNAKEEANNPKPKQDRARFHYEKHE
jgi:hypothetical protein